MVSKPQEVDKGRRNLLVRAATLAGTGAVIGAFSSVEPAYAAVKKIADFRDRKGNINSANSTFHNPQTTTFDTSQGEPVTVQVTPTPDLQATKTALDIKSVELDIQKKQTDNRFAFVTDVGTPAALLITSALGIVTYLYTRNKDRNDRLIDREKRDEARFQEAVLALGKDETKLGAATTLRTLLDARNKELYERNQESYERFYQQIFDLSVGFLRLRKVDQNNPEPDPFYREIIRVFCESTPLVRKKWDLQTLSQSHGRIFENRRRKYLNASHIHLENADLPLADLSLADLNKANLTGAYLSGANLNGADLREADLKGANPEEADSLSGTKMWHVQNYSDPEKRQKCKDKGADFDTPPPLPETQM